MIADLAPLPPANERPAPRCRPRWLTGVVAALVALLVLAGCSSDGDSSQSAANGGDGGEAAVDEGSPENPAPGDRDGSLPFAPETLDRDVVVTADITVRSEDVHRDAERTALLVTTAGGQLSGDVRGGSGERQTADLVLRVPPEDVDDVLAGVADFGEELSRSVRSEDVTTVVADVDSRVASLQATLDRLRALMADASDITDLVALERELAGRETELESLQAQQRSLDDQVALATVTVHLRAAEAAVGSEPAGFLSGLSSGWDAFVTVGATLLTALGAALPFAALLALLVAAALLIQRRRRQLAPVAVASEPPHTS